MSSAARYNTGMFTHAIVIGGGVTALKRDALSQAPESRHIHVLLTRGRIVLESLFPSLQAELGQVGAPLVDWVNDVAALTEQGWMPRYASQLASRACDVAAHVAFMRVTHLLAQRVLHPALAGKRRALTPLNG